MVEVIGMRDVKDTLPVIFFGANDKGKVVAFRFIEGKAPNGETLPKGSWLKFFPGEEDLAGREVDERLRSGVLETYIYDTEGENEAILSVGETAVAAIKRAILKDGYTIDNPEEWQDLTFTLQRKGTTSWKVTIKDNSELENAIKEGLEECEGVSYGDIDELAFAIGMKKDLEDIEEIKSVLTKLKGSYFAFNKNGIKIKKKNGKGKRGTR